MFTGGLNVLSGRRGLVSIRAVEACELIEIEREPLRALVQADSELSDIFLRAFILRRLELIARGMGEIVLIDSSHSLDTFRIKIFSPVIINHFRTSILGLTLPFRICLIASTWLSVTCRS